MVDLCAGGLFEWREKVSSGCHVRVNLGFGQRTVFLRAFLRVTQRVGLQYSSSRRECGFCGGNQEALHARGTAW